MEPHRYLPDNEWPHQLLLVSRSYRFGDSFNGSIHCHARIEAKEIYERERERWKIEKIDGRRSRRATGILRDRRSISHRCFHKVFDDKVSNFGKLIDRPWS